MGRGKPTNGKQLPAFPLEVGPVTEPRSQRWEARELPIFFFQTCTQIFSIHKALTHVRRYRLKSFPNCKETGAFSKANIQESALVSQPPALADVEYEETAGIKSGKGIESMSATGHWQWGNTGLCVLVCTVKLCLDQEMEGRGTEAGLDYWRWLEAVCLRLYVLFPVDFIVCTHWWICFMHWKKYTWNDFMYQSEILRRNNGWVLY